MKVEYRADPREADGWINVLFGGVAGSPRDASHLWLVPESDGTWRLEFTVETYARREGLIALLGSAVSHHFSVFEVSTLHRPLVSDGEPNGSIEESIAELT